MLSFTQARPYNKSLPQSCFLQFLLESTVAFGTFHRSNRGPLLSPRISSIFTRERRDLDLHLRKALIADILF
jgi:hypothetical protein